MITGSRFPFLSQTSPGRALSLLSSKAYPWIPTAELASRSSAALRELIAENRAALLARQLFTNRSWHSGVYDNIQSIISFGPHPDQATAQGTAQVLNGWNQFKESGRGLTLDLMQSPTSASFEFLSRRSKSEEEEEECCAIWKSLEGTHVAWSSWPFFFFFLVSFQKLNVQHMGTRRLSSNIVYSGWFAIEFLWVTLFVWYPRMKDNEWGVVGLTFYISQPNACLLIIVYIACRWTNVFQFILLWCLLLKGLRSLYMDLVNL